MLLQVFSARGYLGVQILTFALRFPEGLVVFPSQIREAARCGDELIY